MGDPYRNPSHLAWPATKSLFYAVQHLLVDLGVIGWVQKFLPTAPMHVGHSLPT
jgi:hypothetical protein